MNQLANNTARVIEIILQADGPAKAEQRFNESYANLSSMCHHEDAAALKTWWESHPQNPSNA